MAKVSKEFIFKVLKHLGVVTLLVIGSTASQQEQSCCTGAGGASSGAGGDGGAGGNEMNGPCFDYANFEGLTPTVTVKMNVLPIFRKSCGFDQNCHGAQMGPAGQPYLGPPEGPTIVDAQITQIFMENVNATSSKASGMKIVDPGKPESSFLMHKMDNTLTCAAVKCDTDCGVSMPKAQLILTPTERDTVRRWIAQGAKND